MQFGLDRLFITVTLVAIMLGLIFAMPPLAGAPLLFMLILTSPAFWIGGIIYARGAWQAFFIGGAISGAIPWGLLFYSYAVVVWQTLQWRSGWTKEMVSPAIQSDWVWMNIWVLAPGVISIIGGGVCARVRSIFGPAK